MNLFRSTPVPGVYTELYRRLIDVVSSSEAGQIIQEITQVLFIFSAPSMTNLMEPPSITVQTSSSLVTMVLEKVVSST